MLPDETDEHIPRHLRWYCNTGSFLGTYGPDGISGYAERFGYDPVELGYLIAEIRDGIIKDIKKVII